MVLHYCCYSTTTEYCCYQGAGSLFRFLAQLIGCWFETAITVARLAYYILPFVGGKTLQMTPPLMQSTSRRFCAYRSQRPHTATHQTAPRRDG